MLFAIVPLVSSSLIFAPYADITGNFDHQPYSDAGVKLFSMAFANVICNTSTPVLGQSMAFDARIPFVQSVRASGGDVIMSFGGALQEDAKEPASCHFNATAVQSFYQKFIDTYNLTYIDIDLEGDVLNDTPSIEVRSIALASLKSANANLKISMTLPVAPQGMLENAIGALNAANAQGLVLDSVNIMAMDYGAGVTAMGDAAINASRGALAQLYTLDMVNTKLGVVPMVGKNDGDSCTFTLEDAQKLYAFANQTEEIGLLSFWQLSSDFELDYTDRFLGRVNGTQRPPRLSFNVCGTSWTDASTTCANACPSGANRDCPSGQSCFDITGSSSCHGVDPHANLTFSNTTLTNSTAPATSDISITVCGTSWTDAATTCAIACPSKLNSECPIGQSCFDITGSSLCHGVDHNANVTLTNTTLTNSTALATNLTLTNSTIPATSNISMAVCGTSWTDAALTCAIACPSKLNSECPSGQSCFDISGSSTCLGVIPGANATYNYYTSSSSTSTSTTTTHTPTTVINPLANPALDGSVTTTTTTSKSQATNSNSTPAVSNLYTVPHVGAASLAPAATQALAAISSSQTPATNSDSSPQAHPESSGSNEPAYNGQTPVGQLPVAASAPAPETVQLPSGTSPNSGDVSSNPDVYSAASGFKLDYVAIALMMILAV